MQTILYAATRYGHRVQVMDGGEIIGEYAAGSCQTESQAIIDPSSSGVVNRSQLRRWAKQTAEEIAMERAAERIEYAPDLELDPCEVVP
jgi:hypothetical protein